MNFIASNLYIGTAQLIEGYGMHESSTKKVQNFITKVFQDGYVNFDTAFSYNGAHSFLKQLNGNKNIVTKFHGKDNDLDLIIKGINDLEINNIDAILFHRSSDLQNDQGLKLLDSIISYRSKNNLSFDIGISIYEKSEWDSLSNYCKNSIELIQLPINPFFSYYKELIEYKTLMGRSLFMQGIFWIHKNNFPNNYLYDAVMGFKNYCNKKNYSIISVLKSFILLKKIKYTIGFNSIDQFNQFISAQIVDIDDMPDFNIDEKYLDPRKW